MPSSTIGMSTGAMLAPISAHPAASSPSPNAGYRTKVDSEFDAGVGDAGMSAGFNASSEHNVIGLGNQSGLQDATAAALSAAANVKPSTAPSPFTEIQSKGPFIPSTSQVRDLQDWRGGLVPEYYGDPSGLSHPIPLPPQPPILRRPSRSPRPPVNSPPSAQYSSSIPPPRGIKRPRLEDPHAPLQPSLLRSSVQSYPEPPVDSSFPIPARPSYIPQQQANMSVNSVTSEPVYRNPPNFTDIPRILPHEKVFNIQIGNELFRLSGASISSDAPSYFTQFFEQELAKLSQAEFDNMGNGPGAPGKPPHQIKTLYIDRDPETFRDIARHLQGYHIIPTDAQHFVRLFADSQFYSLPKLISQLFETDIYITIGGRPFRIPRDVFSSPGDSQNFFSLGISINFSPENELFPGLSREGLLRPPSIVPPNVPNRSGEVFAELLHMLRGYPLKIRSEEHRQELLRDCRYFLFKGLEQKLIAHSISWNPKRNREEIVLRIEDIKRSGINILPDPSGQFSWVNYSRPFMAEIDRELVLEIGGEATKIDWKTRRAEFSGDTNARITALFQVVANKLNLPTNRALGTYMMDPGARTRANSPGSTPLSEDKVKIRIERDCHILLDGEEYSEVSQVPQVQSSFSGDPEDLPSADDHGTPRSNTTGSPGWQQQQLTSQTGPRPPSGNPTMRRRLRRRGSMEEMGIWIVKRAQWRLKVQDVVPTQQTGQHKVSQDLGPAKEIVLYGVKIEALSGEYGRNSLRGFLS